MASSTSSWRGLDNIRYFIIFGDSYSSVGYSSSSPHPTEEEPLGVEFPGGEDTWTTEGEPNWVGYLVSKHLAGRAAGRRPIVFDYAVGGSTLPDVRSQIHEEFLPTAGKKPNWASWSAEDSLFVTWVGINDCAFIMGEKTHKVVTDLFDEQEYLYNTGARNFLFIDLPPLARTPSSHVNLEEYTPAYVFWNNHLKDAVAAFSSAHPDATVMLFSSWETFTRVLDDPQKHGFKPNQVRKPYGQIWMDYLHPTSAMHEWVAKDVFAFLAARPADEDGSEREDKDAVESVQQPAVALERS
ncbi:hypothetical protein CERSUDRAFT_118464 [Gelatoporia subvermispora B]|uniref:Carbohydrate esterase family 16 protein n=1 Tax=Ceriporiopsis subvermispora (strain B) TaxID=914234 RepID=M2R1F3_CERS8|nr:hypothetical protein CERSUDRAFT_118464 [Gelatoporia subvermispora B]